MAKWKIARKNFVQRFEAHLQQLHKERGDVLPIEVLNEIVDKLKPKLKERNRRITSSWNLDKPGHNSNRKKWNLD